MREQLQQRPQCGHISGVFEGSKEARVIGDESGRGRGEGGKVSVNRGEILQGPDGHWKDFGFLLWMRWESL